MHTQAVQKRLQKNQKDILASKTTKTVLTGERTWTDIEPQDFSSIDYPLSKQQSTLLCHSNHLREDDGATGFWRLKDYLRNHFDHSRHRSDEKGKSIMEKCGGYKKRFQYCTDSSGEILCL